MSVTVILVVDGYRLSLHNVTCQANLIGYMPSAEDRLRSKPLWETFRCPGGALSLDFCNSGQGGRNSAPVEWLTSFADLVDWLETAGAIDSTHAVRLRTAG